MTAQQLLTNYPKATKIIRQWFLDKMIESLKTDKVSDEFKEGMKRRGAPDEILISIIESNSRTLFDVFDSNGLYIDIYIGELANKSVDYEVSFGFKVLPIRKEDEHTPMIWYENRKDAENEAIKEAFKRLNK